LQKPGAIFILPDLMNCWHFCAKNNNLAGITEFTVSKASIKMHLLGVTK